MSASGNVFTGGAGAFPTESALTDASLTAAAEIMDWDGLSMPTLEELAGIIGKHRAVAADDVLGFSRRKLAELREVCPEYISFAMDVLQLHAGAPVHAKFRVYSAVTGAFEGDDPDALIRLLAEDARGRTEAETLRRQAAELLERARLLDAKKSRPMG
ncbi:hypothetical protein JIN84_05545 [Luteolibacter yonseiensis]|uniref:Uncharacterized protein n=1 Tax=Luteolibacter yonseiensis TaxID=1144680 RepID=A0A934VB57_9BACT|nr:hypothetical protein [Luteolibacter yonseiensis]MBK1815064.1 hypothetical protein [Luteolibacter yonseiensis]